jgi:hypothetical protein
MIRILACLMLVAPHAVGLTAQPPKDLKYSCTAKGKKGSGDAASSVSAKSESDAVSKMKDRWPGYDKYVCQISK